MYNHSLSSFKFQWGHMFIENNTEVRLESKWILFSLSTPLEEHILKSLTCVFLDLLLFTYKFKQYKRVSSEKKKILSLSHTFF